MTDIMHVQPQPVAQAMHKELPVCIFCDQDVDITMQNAQLNQPRDHHFHRCRRHFTDTGTRAIERQRTV
ncbi:hypothetical protein D3C71_2052480 [compost metagenome]